MDDQEAYQAEMEGLAAEQARQEAEAAEAEMAEWDAEQEYLANQGGYEGE